MTAKPASIVKPSSVSNPSSGYPSEKIVSQKVKDALGHVDEFKEIRCVRVFDNRYRVNVFCEKASDTECLIPSNYIKYSYFITMNPDGTSVCFPEKGSKTLTLN